MTDVVGVRNLVGISLVELLGGLPAAIVALGLLLKINLLRRARFLRSVSRGEAYAESDIDGLCRRSPHGSVAWAASIS